MKLKKLKEILGDMPPDFDEFDVVLSENGELVNDGDYTYRLGSPIAAINIDTNNAEIVLRTISK